MANILHRYNAGRMVTVILFVSLPLLVLAQTSPITPTPPTSPATSGNTYMTTLIGTTTTAAPYRSQVPITLLKSSATFDAQLSDASSQAFQDLQTVVCAQIINEIRVKLSIVYNSIGCYVIRFAKGSVIADTLIEIGAPSQAAADQLANQTVDFFSPTYTFLDGSASGPSTLNYLTITQTTCPSITLTTDYGPVTFQEGAIESRMSASGPRCPYYTIKSGTYPAIEASCDRSYVGHSDWMPVSADDFCGGNLTDYELFLRLNITLLDAEDVVYLAEYTENIANLTEDYITFIAGILERIANLQIPDVELTDSIVDIVNTVALSPEENLEEAQEETRATSRLVEALEEQLSNVNVTSSENSTIRFIKPNLAAEVLDITDDQLRDGISVIMSTSMTTSGEQIRDNDFIVTMGDETETQPEQPEATLFIPADIVNQLDDETLIRLVVTTYRLPSVFQSKNLTDFNNMQSAIDREVNTRIIAASFGNMRVDNLPTPVRLTFAPLKENGTNATCVFFDFNRDTWSSDGCRKLNISTPDKVICECEHLTNFALLMDFYRGQGLSEEEGRILEVLSFIGVSMSMWGLTVTILTYVSSKTLLNRKPNQILVSLSSALLCLYITFLVVLIMDEGRVEENTPQIPCYVLAAILHYFLLASIFWMAVEGYNMYLLFVLVRKAYNSFFMRRASLFAWGAPILIVGVAAGASRENYACTESYFLNMYPLIGGILIPVGLVMVYNFVIFIRINRRLSKTVAGRSVNKTEKRQRIRRLQNAMCIMLLMGLTWAVGYLTVIYQSRQVFQGLFTVLNSMQGYFIFMLYCVRQPKVRKLWREQFRCCLPKRLRESTSKMTSTGGHTSHLKKARRNAGFNSDSTAPLHHLSNSSGVNPYDRRFDPENIISAPRSPPQRLLR